MRKTERAVARVGYPLGAGVIGFALAGALFLSRPAGAQFTQTPRVMMPPGATNSAAPASNPVVMPQPIEVQALDATHFVVATRESRLLRPASGEGSPTQGLVGVVTYYSVTGDRLVPIEHVRAPVGWVPLQTAGD